MNITIDSVKDIGNDVLHVSGTRDDLPKVDTGLKGLNGAPIMANAPYGVQVWKSAILGATAGSIRDMAGNILPFPSAAARTAFLTQTVKDKLTAGAPVPVAPVDVTATVLGV